MKEKNRGRWLLAGTVWLWLGACSHTPDAGDVLPGATFTTKILADGTKLFVYAQRFARRDGDMEGDGGNRGNRSAQVAQITQRGVQTMLAQNLYCRDGYVVLEQYEERTSYVIRGECREAATSADREKFSQ